VAVAHELSATISNLGAEPSRALMARAVAACIGPVTAEAARELGFAARVVAEEHTVDGLLTAILREANPLG
ncbi:MAG: uroporphyrinogen-III synthase, partial [Candidatus Thermoplasmatota archaeon]